MNIYSRSKPTEATNTKPSKVDTLHASLVKNETVEDFKANLHTIQEHDTDSTNKTVKLISLKDEISAQIKEHEKHGEDTTAFQSVMKDIDTQLTQENAKLSGGNQTNSKDASAQPTIAKSPKGMSRSQLASSAEKMLTYDKETAEALQDRITMLKTLEANQPPRQNTLNHGMERVKNMGKTDLERLESALAKIKDLWDAPPTNLNPPPA